MEIQAFSALQTSPWTRVAPCGRAALDLLESPLRDREDAGGRSAVAGLGLFCVRRGSGFEAYLSPGATEALALQLDGLAVAPSAPPADEPGLRLVAGDVELWVTVVRGA